MSCVAYDKPFYNNSGEAIPPFAVMQVDNWKDDANDRAYFRVKKPDGAGRQFIVNGPRQVASGGTGMGTRSPGAHASYNDAATPAVDQEWGPVSGSWLLSSSGTGYVITGDLETIGGINVVRVSELAGSSAFTPLTHFELTENMGYADLAKLAKPVNDDGSLNSGAAAFYVVDMRAVDTSGDAGEFYGRATYTDADTGAVVWSGYQGYAVRFTDDWDETGVPGYKIVTMDQPADIWIGTCAESLSGSPLAAKATYDDTIDPSGGPFSGRRPPLLADSRVTVYDDLDLEPAAGEKWVIKWDRVNARYVYWRKIEASVETGGGAFFLTNESISTATYSGGVLTPAGGTAYRLELTDDTPPTWTVDEGDEHTIYNWDTINGIDNGRVVQCKLIDGFWIVDVDRCDVP